MLADMHAGDRTDIVDLLFERATNDPSGEARATAILLLAKHSDDQSRIDRLLRDRAAEDNESHVRAAILRVRTSCAPGGPEVLELIRSELRNTTDQWVQQVAVHAFACAHYFARDELPPIRDDVTA
jgi:hypothetical protein